MTQMIAPEQDVTNFAAAGEGDVLKDDINWFKIWAISTVVIFVIEFYLDRRQLRNFYQTERPKSIE